MSPIGQPYLAVDCRVAGTGLAVTEYYWRMPIASEGNDMPRITIRHTNEVSSGSFPDIAGVTMQGKIESKGVVQTDDQPMWCWVHHLSPGAQIQWSKPPVAHGVFVWEGAIESDGKSYGVEAALVVEHHGVAAFHAGPEGAVITHFHRRPGHPEVPARSGGHASFFDRDGIFCFDNRPTGGSAVTLYSDSGSETNDVWLHRSGSVPGRKLPSHCHSEDEVIFITKGVMQVGRKALTPGTALAIDQNTAYKFEAGPDGLTFINFRSTQPYYIPVGPEGRGVPRNERETLRAKAPAAKNAATA